MAILLPGTVLSSRPARGPVVPLRVDGAGACGQQWALLGRVLSWEEEICTPRAGMLLSLGKWPHKCEGQELGTCSF